MTTATVSHPRGFGISDRVQARLRAGELTQAQVDRFRDFLGEVDRELMHHPIILQNPYTSWFQHGDVSDDELRAFVQQFSVFSNDFLVAALLRVINAESLEQAHASKEILLNELGVIYRKGDKVVGERSSLNPEDKDREGDPDLVSTEGTVDGGVFRFRAAHFEWLLRIGEHLGLGFSQLGKRKHARPTTLHFCDELRRLYGSDDAQIAEGASFAVENWAAAGFWQELEDGLVQVKKARHPNLPLAFFTWHNRVEGQHAGHTLEELEETYFSPGFDKGKFFQGGREILEAVAVFWDGLHRDRVSGNTRLV
ncbi:MAG: hypothetical protein JWO38_7815 [Gemmataceae bacterium]|nr:hypothetical protein [Gemmataceae bacterium]